MNSAANVKNLIACLLVVARARPLARGLQEGEIRQELQSNGRLRNVLIITKTIEGAAEHLAYVRAELAPWIPAAASLGRQGRSNIQGFELTNRTDIQMWCTLDSGSP
ncbi:MAG: hypothetical protein WAK03_14670 [Methylocystis sp.]|jgi:hypothetical protein